MTNLEKIIENDGERFAKAIADILCFHRQRLNIEEPFSCGDCEFNCAGTTECDTDRIAEWLKEEAEEDKLNLRIETTAVSFFEIDKKFRESFFKKEGE